MKLLNKSIQYLSVSILGIITIWSIVFYVNMLNEIKSSIDEGLENYKRLIVQNAEQDTTLLTKTYFDESFFAIKKITKEEALSHHDKYLDTTLLMQDTDDEAPEPEPVRMLITTFELHQQHYELMIANSMVEEDDLIDELLWDVITLYLILIVGIIFVNNVLLKKLWKPFYDFLGQLKSFQLGGKQELPTASTDIKEFDDLEKAVNSLLLQNIQTFEQQKQFIGNASHELQTPLAITTHKLELLLENKTLQTSDAERITEIYTIIQRLIRLNKSLLLLAKIENKQFPDQQEVHLNDLVNESIRDLEDYIQFKQLEIHLSDTQPLHASMDPALANILISNLIRNAVFHSTENSSISIHISSTKISISNTGNPVKLDDDAIFSRFYKSNTSSNSTGLGLAITKAITDLYHYQIDYRFAGASHTFSVVF